MGGREKAEPESSGGRGIARASVRARYRTCVAQGTGSETVTTRAAACGLMVAAPRPSSRRVFTRRGHPRSTKLERWMPRPSLAPHTHDDAVMQQPHSAVRQRPSAFMGRLHISHGVVANNAPGSSHASGTAPLRVVAAHRCPACCSSRAVTLLASGSRISLIAQVQLRR